jgi:tetratricopeptide (TPR) repeat protein
MPHNGTVRRALFVLFASALTATVAGPAVAVEPEAVKKFEEGKRLRSEGKCNEALRPFEESLKAEKTIGAYYNLGFCHEQLKDYKKAFENYRAAEKMAHEKGDGREQEIREAGTRLLREVLHWVRLTVPETIADTPGLKVTVDGEVVPPSAYADEYVFRDRTTHDVVVSATGRKDWTLANQPDRKSIIALLGDPAPEKALTPPPGADATAERGWGWRELTALGLGVGGLGALVTTGIWFVDYRTKQSRLDDRRKALCNQDGNPSCNFDKDKGLQQAEDEYQDNESTTRRQAPLFITIGVAGVFMIGGAAVLLLTAPKGAAAAPATGVHVAPALGAREQGAVLVGTF